MLYLEKKDYSWTITCPLFDNRQKVKHLVPIDQAHQKAKRLCRQQRVRLHLEELSCPNFSLTNLSHIQLEFCRLMNTRLIIIGLRKFRISGIKWVRCPRTKKLTVLNKRLKRIKRGFTFWKLRTWETMLKLSRCKLIWSRKERARSRAQPILPRASCSKKSPKCRSESRSQWKSTLHSTNGASRITLYPT